MTPVHGISVNNITKLDPLTKLGYIVGARDYSRMDTIMDYATNDASKPRRVCGSQKFKNDHAQTYNGKAYGAGVISSKLIPNGDFKGQIQKHAQAMMACGSSAYGKGICVYDHEPDVGTLNGTVADLIAAIKYCNAQARAVPGFSDHTEIGVVVGSYNQTLFPQFEELYHDADIVLLDQPYVGAGMAAGQVAAFMDARMKTLRDMGLKRFGIGEWGATQSLANRAAALDECVAWFDAQPDIEIVYQWDASPFTIYGTPEQAQFIKIIDAHSAVPVPADPRDAQIVTLKAQVAGLQTQITNLNNENNQLNDENNQLNYENNNLQTQLLKYTQAVSEVHSAIMPVLS